MRTIPKIRYSTDTHECVLAISATLESLARSRVWAREVVTMAKIIRKAQGESRQQITARYRQLDKFLKPEVV